MFSKRVKGRAVPAAGRAGAVAVTDFCTITRWRYIAASLVVMLLLAAPGGTQLSRAAVLPEDRADALYHSYDGGGVKISGPSLLVRKRVGNNASVSGNYYVDSVTSASIDVVTSASPYSERRRESSVSMDYLEGDALMNVAYTKSEESDFHANSAHVNFSQEMFGNLTIVSMGYSHGWDEVGMRDSDFSEDVSRDNYRVGISQIVTKNFVLDAGLETISDEGYLNNPYRSVRFVNPDDPKGYSRQQEVYPSTRTSNAVSVKGMHYLPYRAAARLEYRLYQDSWGIQANNWEVGYVQPWRQRWLIDVRYRRYSQSHADFYSDLFPYRDAQNYLARDKELSTFTSDTMGVTLSYEMFASGATVKKSTLNLSYHRIQYNYKDFRDLRVQATPGTEPTYDFAADVLQFYLSVWY
jgi:hypothetical protein